MIASERLCAGSGRVRDGVRTSRCSRWPSNSRCRSGTCISSGHVPNVRARGDALGVAQRRPFRRRPPIPQARIARASRRLLPDLRAHSSRRHAWCPPSRRLAAACRFQSHAARGDTGRISISHDSIIPRSARARLLSPDIDLPASARPRVSEGRADTPCGAVSPRCVDRRGRWLVPVRGVWGLSCLSVADVCFF